MPKPQNVNFIGWIEDLFKGFSEIPKETWAVYYSQKQRAYKVVQVKASTLAKTPESAYISTFTQGEESFRDIVGVNTVVNLENLVKSPVSTLSALGKSTVEDILNINEISDERLSRSVEAAVNGRVSRPGKEDISSPDSAVVQVANFLGLKLTDGGVIIDPVTKRSRIQLLGSPTEPRLATIEEDRKVLEEGENRTKYYKPYKDLAGTMTGLAGYADVTEVRQGYYTQSLSNYNRILLDEFGIKMDSVLPTSIGTVSRNGTLFTEILQGVRDPNIGINWEKNITDLQNNDARMINALGLSANPNAWNTLAPELKDYIKASISAEFYSSEEIKALTQKTIANGLQNVATRGQYLGFIEDIYGSSIKDELADALVNNPGKVKDVLFLAGATPAAQKFHSAGVVKISRKDARTRKSVFEAFESRESLKQQLEAGLRASIRRPQILAAVQKRAEGDYNALVLAQLNQALAPRVPLRRIEDIPDVDLRRHHQLASREFGRKAVNRVMSASDTINIAHQLFFASTIEEMLDQIESGSFIKAAIINSKFFGLLPFTSSTTGGVGEITKGIDKLITVIDTRIIKTKEFIATDLTGIVFEGNDAQYAKLSPVAKSLTSKSKVNVEWKEVDTATGQTTAWHQKLVNASELGGLYGDYGVYDIISKSFGDNGKLLSDLGLLGVAFDSAEDLLKDPRKLDDLLNNLEVAAEWLSLNPGAAPRSAYETLAKVLQLDQNLPSFREQMHLFASKGKDFLTVQLGNDGLTPELRWDFLTRLAKQNKLGQITNKYMGILNAYNRYANAINTFMYKQIIFGKYAGNNFLLRTLIKGTGPIRGFLQNMGFSDEIWLAQRIQQLKYIRALESAGEELFAKGIGSTTGKSFLSRGLGSRYLSMIGRTKGGAQLLKGLGFILKGASGIATGLAGWVIAAFGEVGWVMAKNILTFNFSKAISESIAIFKSKILTLKKLLWGIIIGFFACSMVPVLIVLFIVGALFAPLENAGGGSFEATISENFKVEKTADPIEITDPAQRTITYTVKITNTAKDEAGNPIAAKIGKIVDTMTYTESCANGGVTQTIPANSELGRVMINGKNKTPTIEDLDYVEFLPNESREFTFSIEDIQSSSDGSYTNIIDIYSEGETGKYASSSASTKVQEGGCNQCPSGWPTDGGIITQGPAAPDSSHTAYDSEAIDISNSIGTEVMATHNGVATANPDKCSEEDYDYYRNYCVGSCCNVGLPKSDWCLLPVKCGFGNHVRIQGTTPQGASYTTIFAHLSGFAISGTASVNFRQVIGYLGDSGYSSGPHLHYEFANETLECFPGFPMRMENVIGTSYIPTNLGSRSCGTVASCGVSW